MPSRAYRIAGPLALMCLASGCARSGSPRQETNLLEQLPYAERRALLPIDKAIRIDIAGPDTDRRVGMVVQAPARVIWSRRLEPKSRLRGSFVLASRDEDDGVTLRFGVSDHRVYEGLFSHRLDAAAGGTQWQPLDVDLSAYGGWQWSLFYRPWETTWRLNVSVDATPHGAIAVDRLRIDVR